jgi:hypothetical protein
MEEHYLTGYCRVLDSARVVELVTEDGTIEDCDCCYGNCKFQSQCTVAKSIEEMLKITK